MSFILDALKKSESERQRQGGPGFADVPLGRIRPSRPWWIVVVGALLLANLVVLTVVLARRESPAPVAQSAAARASVPSSDTVRPAPSPPAAIPQRVAAQSPVADVPAAQPTTVVASAGAPAVPASGPTAQMRAPPVTRTAPATSSSLAEAAGAYDPDAAGDPTLAYDEEIESAAASVPGGPPRVTAMPGAVRDEPTETLPTINDLNLSGSAALPDLHLDIHVYATNPRDRFVFINMHKYVEGQQLAEGPSVERITRDGVVLDQRGIRFLLPRQ